MAFVADAPIHRNRRAQTHIFHAHTRKNTHTYTQDGHRAIPARHMRHRSRLPSANSCTLREREGVREIEIERAGDREREGSKGDRDRERE
jgi:ribulose-5-phosphate 4-epimerase/fuculose-1-phosphate aldolase